MKIDRTQYALHMPWALSAFCLVVALCGWYSWASYERSIWLGGGSDVGLVCGMAAATIILFEMLLWPRKALRRMRLGATRHWMSAHIWFGLACVPLAVVHSGFHWGGGLAAALLILLLLTVLSGLHGLLMQNLLPSWMLHNLPAETIYSQINHVSRQSVEDAEQMMIQAFGPLEADERSLASVPAMEVDALQAVVVGATQQTGRFIGRVLRTTNLEPHRGDKRLVWELFCELRPYLLLGRQGVDAETEAKGMNKRFERLRQQCHVDTIPLLEVLENLHEQRRQFDLQSRAHAWLHGWLPLHVGLSVGLAALLLIHILVALRYR